MTEHAGDLDSAGAQLFRVVVNDEEQYSLWPHSRELPVGWNEVGKIGGRSECLAYIEQVWRDMRPRSLRDRMEYPRQDSGS